MCLKTNRSRLSNFIAVAACIVFVVVSGCSSGSEDSLSNSPKEDGIVDGAVVDAVADMNAPSDVAVSADASAAGDVDTTVVADVPDFISTADVMDIDGDAETPIDVVTDPADMGEPGFLQWAIPTERWERYLGVAIDGDGNFLVPREEVDSKDYHIVVKTTLVKISPDGAILAERELSPVSEYQRPQIRPDGTVLVAQVTKSENGGPCGGAMVFAYGPDLEDRWIYKHSFALRHLLAIRSDNVVLGHFGNTVLALSPMGEPLWQIQLEQSPYCDGDPSADPRLVTSPLYTPIAIGHDDVAYAFEYFQGAHKVVAIAPDGQVLWKQTYGGNLYVGGAAISPGGMVFFYNFGVPPSGDVLYTLTGGYSNWKPLITGIGETVIGTPGQALLCKDTEKQVWLASTSDIKADSYGVATHTEQGQVIGWYSGGSLKTPGFSVIDAATGVLIRHHYTAHYPSLGASVLTDDGLIVGPDLSEFGKPLVAYQLPYGGLAKTGWPKMYSDNQNSNRVRGPKSLQ